ncbi:MAG: hypothetical protein HDR00_01970 [Lachnospiraceae bacterium]|nr:hypothetical protein [Lachnospiraceae bacterium]
MKKSEKAENNALNDFWEKERQANQTRKKNLDGLDYVQIPFQYIPKSLLSDNDAVQDCMKILEALGKKKIVNLTGYSNTDLKIQYGTANLTVLSEYDENYTLYARTIYKLARTYYDNGYESNAAILLEKAIESGTDITGNYTLLAEIYQKKGEQEKIKRLIDSAGSLRSMTQKSIIQSLEEYVREC